MENINSLRHAIVGLAPTPQMRRYPVELRARIRAFVLRHPEESLGMLARQLDVAPATLERFVDEVGYLSYENRHADLLFEVVTRRYELQRPVVITTNKAFREWGEVFPSAACVVTLVDRLVHRSEVVQIEGPSFRLKEAAERKKGKS